MSLRISLLSATRCERTEHGVACQVEVLSVPADFEWIGVGFSPDVF